MKNNVLKKSFTALLAIILIVGITFGGISIINNKNDKPLQRSIKLEATETVNLSSLTQEDLNYIFELGNTYISENSNATEEDVDTYLKNEMIQLCVAKPFDEVDYYNTGLTKAEFWLAAKHPFKALKVNNCRNQATSKANEFYSEGLYQGNGDAFRHVYWNALMTIEIGASWAESFATAHESETADGIDKTMDLNNNASGRNAGATYSDLNEDDLAEQIKTNVTNGFYVRIVNEELVATNGEGLK